jgi:hypothetical protein
LTLINGIHSMPVQFTPGTASRGPLAWDGMSEPQRRFFSVTDFDGLSVATALIQGDVLTIAEG